MENITEIKKYIRKAKDLEVYKRAYKISLVIHKHTFSFPKVEQYELASQMRRASKSVCANLTEGFSKQKHSQREFKRFIYMAIGSSEEMLVWIDYSMDLGYIDQQTYGHWQEEYDAITRMLYSLHAKIKINS